jgi:hypothetical protein
VTTAAVARSPRSIWWEPRQPDWWVAALFAVGASCFLLGSTPGYVNLVGVQADCITYFVGSIFFTSAAWLQLLVSVGAVKPGVRTRRAARWRSVQRAPRNPAWWAGVVQFAGTLLFNVSTYAAMDLSLSAEEAQRRVWAPDAFGSIAFLVASALAFSDVARPWFRWRPKDLAWSVTWLNMIGSIAFGLSAIGAKVIVSTGDLRDAQLANAGTWVGALCFLLGAVLLIPEELGDRH